MRLPREVFVVVRRGDEFLFLYRSPQQGSYWHCVSGALEEGESFAQAAGRELLEETGLDATPVDLERFYDYDVEGWESHYTPGAERIRVGCFLVDAPPGWEPTLDWEHDDYRWCGAEEAVELLHWPEPRELLREIAGR